MAEIRETHIERDAEGRPIDTRVTIDRPKKRGGGFGWGLLFGVLIIAGALLAFAYTQGSFQQAGVEADQATAQVQEQSQQVAQNAEQAVDNATPDTANSPDTTSDATTN
jgi:cytoskeletal protein RodZ